MSVLTSLSHASSCVLYSAYNRSPDLQPIDTVIQLFIHQPNNHDIVPSDQVQAMLNLARCFWIIWWSDDALRRMSKDLCQITIPFRPRVELLANLPS
jgi:hypothetical protein